MSTARSKVDQRRPILHLIYEGDASAALRQLAPNSVDAVITDPPYGYGFLGKTWDKDVPSVEIWRECLRVLKPGGWCVVMSAPRSDVHSAMVSRLQEAGFQLDFSPIYWTYASGFTKAENMRKRLERLDDVRAAKSLDGAYAGFQPKPAVEVIIVAMKPLSEKSFTDQARKDGKGVSWLDKGRIPTTDVIHDRPNENKQAAYTQHTGGRFPANLLVSNQALATHSRYFSLDSWAATLPFLVVPKAARRERDEGLDDFEERLTEVLPIRSKGKRRSERRTRRNHHPTVKPLTLMAYLTVLFSCEGDVILDPFLGSGTTLVAAKRLGRSGVGIEREPEYCEIARARIDAALSDNGQSE